MRRSLASAALGLALLGGCSTPAENDAAPATTKPASNSSADVALADVLTLTCEGAIAGDPPPPGYETGLDVVALPTGQTLVAYDSGDPSTPALFAKTGLVVRAGTPSELEVAPQPGNRVAIGWGNRAFGPSPRFVVPACPDTYGTGWLVYPGGYWADRPLCLPLTVRAGGREQQVRIGVGAACP